MLVPEMQEFSSTDHGINFGYTGPAGQVEKNEPNFHKDMVGIVELKLELNSPSTGFHEQLMHCESVMRNAMIQSALPLSPLPSPAGKVKLKFGLCTYCLSVMVDAVIWR